MSTETHLDDNGDHIKTVFYVGQNSEWRIELHANGKADCRPQAPRKELEQYVRVEVRVFQHSIARGSKECFTFRKPSEMGLTAWDGCWSPKPHKYERALLEHALEFVQAAQTAHSPLYWRLPDVAPGAPITTVRGSDGCHEQTRVSFIEGLTFVIATPEGLAHPRRRCNTLDEFTEVVVSVEDCEGKTLPLGELFPGGRSYRTLPGSVGPCYLFSTGVALSVLTQLVKCAGEGTIPYD